MDYIRSTEEATIDIQEFFIDDCYEYSGDEKYRLKVGKVLIDTRQHYRLKEFIICAQNIRNISYIELLEYAIEQQNKKAQLLLLDYVDEYTLSDRLFEIFYNNYSYLFWLSDHYDFPITPRAFDIMNKDCEIGNHAKIILNGYSDIVWEISIVHGSIILQGKVDITQMINDDNGNLMKIFCIMFKKGSTEVTSLLDLVCRKDKPQCFDILMKETDLSLLKGVKKAYDQESMNIIAHHKKQWDVDLKQSDSMIVFNKLKHNQTAVRAFKYLFPSEVMTNGDSYDKICLFIIIACTILYSISELLGEKSYERIFSFLIILSTIKILYSVFLINKQPISQLLAENDYYRIFLFPIIVVTIKILYSTFIANKQVIYGLFSENVCQAV